MIELLFAKLESMQLLSQAAEQVQSHLSRSSNRFMVGENAVGSGHQTSSISHGIQRRKCGGLASALGLNRLAPRHEDVTRNIGCVQVNLVCKNEVNKPGCAKTLLVLLGFQGHCRPQHSNGVGLELTWRALIVGWELPSGQDAGKTGFADATRQDEIRVEDVAGPHSGCKAFGYPDTQVLWCNF
jgi:hypothetical protein